MPDFAKVFESALNLKIEERALLVEKLLDSLDTLDEQDWEALWFKEAERRRLQLLDGRAVAVPSTDVHRKIEQLLQ